MLAGLAALVLALLGAGFTWFAAEAQRAEEAPAHADGIVVLTGGAGRLELGLRLLAERRAGRLLISGTGRGELGDLLAAAGLDPLLAAAVAPGAVTLGRGARSTRGNARETADWVAAHGLRSLIVVTSGYHMRRALIELHRTVPAAVALFPAPLVPRLADGQDHVPLRLLAAEYGKWLGALAGLSGWVGRDDEGAPAAPKIGG
jgi:uncharacterized SAM-binding protein YcdF (DUF218 family)